MPAAADADLLLMCYTPVTARVIDAAAKLKGIVKYGVGIDAIDIPAAMRRGIPVVNVPEYAEETVAEGAFALLLALAKRLPEISRTMQEHGWIWPASRWLGRDLAGSTLGLVGCGRIGRSMARMAGQGFRARVLGFDPYVDAAAMASAASRKQATSVPCCPRATSCLSTAVLNDATGTSSAGGACLPQAGRDPRQRLARRVDRRAGAGRNGRGRADRRSGARRLCAGTCSRSPAIRSARYSGATT